MARNPFAKAKAMKADMAKDKKRGIKEGSAKDLKIDKKAGLMGAPDQPTFFGKKKKGK